MMGGFLFHRTQRSYIMYTQLNTHKKCTGDTHTHALRDKHPSPMSYWVGESPSLPAERARIIPKIMCQLGCTSSPPSPLPPAVTYRAFFIARPAHPIPVWPNVWRQHHTGSDMAQPRLSYRCRREAGRCASLIPSTENTPSLPPSPLYYI